MHHKVQRRLKRLLRHLAEPLHDHLRNRRISGNPVMGHRPALAQRHHQGSFGPCPRGRDVAQRLDACPSPGVACRRLAAKRLASRCVGSHLLSPRPAFAGRRVESDGLVDWPSTGACGQERRPSPSSTDDGCQIQNETRSDARPLPKLDVLCMCTGTLSGVCVCV